MAVRIRMKRLGRRHRPFFRICVMDARSPRDGTAIEEIGHYDPMIRDKSQRVVVNMDRVRHWISVGAKPTEKVAALLRKVDTGDWGQAKAPPPLTAPKERTAPPEPEAEAAPEETADTPAEQPAEAPAEA